MSDTFEFEGCTVKREIGDMSVNFVVSNAAGYQCRLVPGEWGFEVSKLDEALGNEIDHNFIIRLNEYIAHHDF